MPQSFNCPNCSAPLDVKGTGTSTVRCQYCGTSVIIPEELRGKAAESSVASSLQAVVNDVLQNDMDTKLESIKELALAGNRILAIRTLRDTYTVGLKQAADMVDAIHRGEEVDLRKLQDVTPSARNLSKFDPAVLQQIVDRIKSGDKIAAIKLFRQEEDAGLKAAMDTVNEMEAAISASPDGIITEVLPRTSSSTFTSVESPVPQASTKRGGSCLLVGFILFIILVTVIPILIGMTSSGGPLANVWARINPFAVGRMTLSFGKEGTGPGYFTDARFVSVDNNGHIFVGEFDGGRVQVFDNNGKYLSQWKATGEETGNIYLSGMAAGRDGTVYVVVGSQLYVYDGLNGSLLGRMDHPDGWGFDDVTLAPDGSVVAAWYKNRDDILRFSTNGRVTLLLENAIGNVTGDSEMEMKVAVDGTGNIYALAYFNEAIFVFSPDGHYVSRFGSQGDAKGQFSSPTSIAVDNLGKIYIADYPGVMIYAGDGRYLNTLAVNGAVMGMTFDDQNNLYVVSNEQVLRYKLK
jgi:outer membrane protein assembly factor BamB/ribosomal protein L7/L12